MIKGEFRERKNRFTGVVDLEGHEVPAHVPNSGRLRELLRPGAEVYLVEKKQAHRLTQYDLALVRYRGLLVSVDARVPNQVVREAINAGQLTEFSGFRVSRSEVAYGRSRLDLLLEDNAGRPCLVEVKSVTLVEEGTARFPDAPTQRGGRHLEELVRAVSEGYRAAVIFLVQREDARAFAPNDSTDPAFGEGLRRAVAAGVEAFAFVSRVTFEEIKITGPLPVRL